MHSKQNKINKIFNLKAYWFFNIASDTLMEVKILYIGERIKILDAILWHEE